VAAFAIVLGVGGVAKMGRPEGAVGALRALRLPATATMVRVLAGAELVVAVVVLVSGNRLTSLLMAISYFGFAGFVLLARRDVGTLSSCGCFGEADTPPTVTHLVFTLAAAMVAVVAVVAPVGPLVAGLRGQPLGGAPFLFFTGCCAWFGYASLAVLPKVTSLVRPR